MHFWNKLSTAALIRLTILASLNLLLGRMLDGWLLVLHPLFFLTIVTLDLGLYALMVYSGTLNKTLIAMMLAGLAGVLAVLAYAGADASAFAYGGRFQEVAEGIERLVNWAIEAYAGPGSPPLPKHFWWATGLQVAYLVVDAMGLGAVVAAGLLARALLARSRRRDAQTPPQPLDSGAASPL